MSRFIRLLFAPSLLLLVAVSSGVIVATYCPGGIDRRRVNKQCEWVGDAAFPIDWQNVAHRAHLVADAQLAEDLAVRYADADFLRLYGSEGHGGLIDNHRVVDECMARLVAVIEHNHAVTAGQIAVARGQRSLIFDVAAALSFVPLYLFGATVTARRLDHRFSSDPRSVRWVATGLTSAIASVLGIQLGQLWGSVWEAVRVRNGHMSMFRAATWNRWPHHHASALFVGGIVAFWLIAALWRRIPRRLPAHAATFACAMLVAMFVDVFVQHATGYALAVGVLVSMAMAIRHAERSGDVRLVASRLGGVSQGGSDSIGRASS